MPDGYPASASSREVAGHRTPRVEWWHKSASAWIVPRWDERAN